MKSQQQISQLIVYLVQKKNISLEVIKGTWTESGQNSAIFIQKLQEQGLLEERDLQEISDSSISQIGPYLVEGELARGGMGIIYKAHDQEMNRKVAIKVLSPALISSQQQVQRFLREAKVHSKLNHPAILPIFRLGCEGNRHYFSMPLIEGGNLEDICRDSNDLTEKLQIFYKTCLGVHHAHEQGVIHRDIKPSNILVDKEKSPFVADFGLAKILDSQTILTQSGVAIGTAFYMSPEQIRGDRKIGPATDIYSLGMVLYLMLTRTLPFQADTFPKLAQQITYNAPTPPTRHNQKIPADLEAICLKAIAKEPSSRYKTATLMAKDIAAFLAGEKVSVKTSSFSKLEYLWQKYRAYGFATLATLIVGVIFLFSTFIQQPNKSKKLSLKQLWHKVNNSPHLPVEKLLPDLKKIMTARPDFVPALLLYEEILFKEKQWEDLHFHWLRLLSYPIPEEKVKSIAQKNMDLGNWDLAISFWQKSLTNRKNIFAHQQLAQIYLISGQIEKAEQEIQILQRWDEVDIVLLNIHLLYLQEKSGLALEIISKYLKKNLTPAQHGQALMWQALHHWQSLQSSLNNASWLFYKYQKFDNQTVKVISPQLKAIEIKLAESKKILSQQKQTPMVKNALEVVNEHIPFITLEQKNSLQNNLPKDQLISHHNIFLYKVLLRSYIRNDKQWEKILPLANRLIRLYPWVSDFRHFQGLAYSNKGQYVPALRSIQKASALKRNDYNPDFNLSVTLYKNLSQEEYRIIGSLFNRSREGTLSTIKKSIWQYYFKKVENQLSSPKNFVQPLDFSKLENVFYNTNSSESRKFIIQSLLDSNQYTKLQEWVNNLEKKQYKKLKALKQTIESLKSLKTYQEVRTILFHYFILNEDIYLNQIQKLGENGEQILSQILANPKEKPIVKSMAAQMLVSLCTESSIKILKSFAQGPYPESIVASKALYDKKICPPILSQKTIQTALAKANSPEGKFYTINIALQRYSKEMEVFRQTFLNHPDDLVFLSYVVGNSITQKPSASTSMWNESWQRLINIMNKKDLPSNLRIWAHETFLIMANRQYFFSKYTSQQKREMLHLFWNKYKKAFYQLFSSSQETEAGSALEMIYEVRWFFGQSRESFPQDTYVQNIVTQLWQRLDQDKGQMQLLAAFALSVLEQRSPRITNILGEEKYPVPVRFALFSGTIRNIQILMRNMPSFLKYLESNPQTRAGRSIQKTIIFIFATNFSAKRSNPVLKNFYQVVINKVKNAKSSSAQEGYINATLWIGSKEDIPLLKNKLKDPNINIRRAAAASLASLWVKNFPNRIPDLLRLIQHDPILQKSAAWGLYDLANEKIWLDHVHEKGKRGWHKKQHRIIKKFATLKRFQSLKTAGRIYPSPHYTVEAAIMAVELKRWEQAKKLVQKTFRLLKNENSRQRSPYSTNYIQARAQELHALIEKNAGNSKWAKLLEKSLESNPFQQSTYKHLGNYYLKQKNYPLAIKHLWSHYLIPPNNSISHIVKAYKQAGQNDLATQAYFEYFSIRNPTFPTQEFQKYAIRDWLVTSPQKKPWNPAKLPPSPQKAPKAWEKVKNFAITPTGIIHLHEQFARRHQSISFARTNIWSPTRSPARFIFGSDDGIRIWVNRKVVVDQKVDRQLKPDKKCNIILEKGWNEVVLEVYNNTEEWSFILRVVDRKGQPMEKLKYSATQ